MSQNALKMTLVIHQEPQDIISAYGANAEISRYIKAQIKQNYCWGYIEDLREINIYYNPAKITKTNLLELFAHELCHAGYPEIRSSKYNEEKFCAVIAAITVRAYDLTKRLL
jgi:hypothetical protein